MQNIIKEVDFCLGDRLHRLAFERSDLDKPAIILFGQKNLDRGGRVGYLLDLRGQLVEVSDFETDQIILLFGLDHQIAFAKKLKVHMNERINSSAVVLIVLRNQLHRMVFELNVNGLVDTGFLQLLNDLLESGQLILIQLNFELHSHLPDNYLNRCFYLGVSNACEASILIDLCLRANYSFASQFGGD